MMTQHDQRRQLRTNADGVWKRVLTDLLPECLALVAPKMHKENDWAVSPLALDKEFQAVARQAAVAPRVADMPVQLRLLTGDQAWLVLHVEVQGQVQDDFAIRMYTYAALLHLRLWRQRRTRQSAEPPPLILGLALLTDGQADWRPGPYEAPAFGLGVRYDYQVVKLLDWRKRRDELATTPNPVALIIDAWLGVLAAHGRTTDLLAVARATWRQARRGDYDSAQVATILAFLDGAIALSAALQDELLAELAREEGITVAQVMSRFERQGLRKGRQEGREEGREEGHQEMTLLLLNHKFGPLDEATVARIGAQRPASLLALYTAALDFTARTELDRWLDGESKA